MRKFETNGFLCELSENAAVFSRSAMRIRISFITPSIVRVTCTEGRPFTDRASRIVTADRSGVAFGVEEDDRRYLLTTRDLHVTILKQSGGIEYARADGYPLLREPEQGGKRLTPRPVHRNVFEKDQSIALQQSVDGARATATSYETVLDRIAFEAELKFVFADDEAIFGLGSHEEGYGNLRGHSRDLYQQNMKAVVPYFVSTRGYGVLLDCTSLMTFRDDGHGACWWADVVEELDFYIIQGQSFEEITRGYYVLTGVPPMLPRWAFGYLQSKERYVNAREMLDVVREHRRRDIPLDGIVLDWKSWPSGAGWGQKSFDTVRFPDPEEWIRELHGLGAHLMLSIWPIMTGGCADQRELLCAECMLGNQATYNAFLPEARACYWDQATRGLFAKGVDAWWCDCTEPFEADWAGAVKMGPQLRLETNTREAKLYLDAGEINAYSLLHCQGIYEGQRGVSENKRVFNLTRSSYAGQHRYGTVTWNGDVSATWETLRRCIPEGVNFCATGEPYWTVDAGGFFVDSKPELWFWRGEYPANCRGLTDPNALEPDPVDTGSGDLGYWELYTRWLQYAAFLPVFRSHGTDVAREAWRFGEPGTPFYDAICRCIRLRYRFLPYIYSLAAHVSLYGAMMVRAVALEFPWDLTTHHLLDQYLFGAKLMVCPVVSPMYYEKQSRPLFGVSRSRQVYLPQGVLWFDFWTGKSYKGGQTVAAHAPLDMIPLFVQAGAILPLTEVLQFTEERAGTCYEIHVYTGVDGRFMLYEDAGDGYEYEKGAYALMELAWLEDTATLILGARQGSFPELVQQRDCMVYFHSGAEPEMRRVLYTGEELRVQRQGAAH